MPGARPNANATCGTQTGAQNRVQASQDPQENNRQKNSSPSVQENNGQSIPALPETQKSANGDLSVQGDQVSLLNTPQIHETNSERIVNENASATNPNVKGPISGNTPLPVHPIDNIEPLVIQLPLAFPNPTSTANTPPKISSIFDKPTNNKQTQNPSTKNTPPAIQPSKQHSHLPTPLHRLAILLIKPNQLVMHHHHLLLSLIHMSQGLEPYMKLISNP